MISSWIVNKARVSRLGILVAQAGAALMILGGIGDLSIRVLLPNHQAFLGHPVAPATETLLLSLLHALGAALTAVGIGAFVLLRLALLSNSPQLALVAAGIAVLAEGTNAAGMYHTGSPFFVAPVSFMLIIVAGVTVHLAFRPVRAAPNTARQGTKGRS